MCGSAGSGELTIAVTLAADFRQGENVILPVAVQHVAPGSCCAPRIIQVTIAPPEPSAVKCRSSSSMLALPLLRRRQYIAAIRGPFCRHVAHLFPMPSQRSIAEGQRIPQKPLTNGKSPVHRHGRWKFLFQTRAAELPRPNRLRRSHRIWQSKYRRALRIGHADPAKIAAVLKIACRCHAAVASIAGNSVAEIRRLSAGFFRPQNSLSASVFGDKCIEPEADNRRVARSRRMPENFPWVTSALPLPPVATPLP